MAPFTFRGHWTLDEDSPSISPISLELVTLLLSLQFFVFLLMFEIGMELVNPFLVDFEKHQ